MNPLLRTAWDRLSLYLPVALMGVFALGTWWLVRNTPTAREDTMTAPARHEADYFLRNFAIRSFDAQGRLRNEVLGAVAEHFPDTDAVEMQDVRMRSFDEQGLLTRSTARRAVSNRDGSEVRLAGDVHVVRESAGGTAAATPPVDYRGEFLLIQSNPERLSSHLPVVITRGADQFHGNTMNYDKAASTFELKGQVRGVLQPRPAR